MSRCARFLAPIALCLASACAHAPAPSTVVDPAATTSEAMVWPKRLVPGDTIALVAPAGELDRERMALARTRLEARGYKVVQREDLFASEGYLAGSDERRAAELMEAFRDPEVDAIFPGTGGYGTMRILERLDYSYIRAHPKMLLGFSDITGLHAAIQARAGVVSLHSPGAMFGLGSPEGMTPFTERWFFRALEDQGSSEADSAYQIEPPADAPLGSFGRGKARGRLVGGNLSLISALEGTPYAIDTRDAILLIEDVREAPYRIDRMLRQLELSGKLAQLRGAVLAQFTRNYDREDEQRRTDPRFSVDGVLAQYFAEAGIPVLTNFPLGHVENNASLPLGGVVEIDADARTLRVLPDAQTSWRRAEGRAAVGWTTTHTALRTGAVHSTWRAGVAAGQARWQVTAGERELQAEADELMRRLEDLGFETRVGFGLQATGNYAVRLPDFADREAAESARRRLRAAGFEATTARVMQDLSNPTGPWVAEVLELDPAAFRVEVEHSADAAIGVETTRSLADRHGALAAVNGGYYVTRGLLRGDSTGLLRVDGEFLSEPDRGRASVGLVVEEGRLRPIFGRFVLRTELRLDDDSTIAVDGLNRARGRGETILYTPQFHSTTLTDGSGMEFTVLDGRIADRRAARGSSPIPAGGYVVSVGAERALQLVEERGVALAIGSGVSRETTLLARHADGMTSEEIDVRWSRASDVISGGPLLLRAGRRVSDPESESFSQVFCRARHPRTALGVRADGGILLVVVDGRQPAHSVGMSIPELQDFLLELGAVDAINLDGGGSSTMVVDGKVVNRPSDPSGERENADALLVFPAGAER